MSPDDWVDPTLAAADDPPTTNRADPESPAIRVACASNHGERLDGHFGSAQRFLIFDVGPERIDLVEIRTVSSLHDAAAPVQRLALIDDCQLLYVAEIGGPAAARVTRRGIHPLKIADGAGASSHLERLQNVLADRPPPWLAKHLGRPAAVLHHDNARDDDDDDDDND